ncbi:MAG: hypothetical protein JXB49_34005 [Bacteroidales bacterium]|nr:hypothetical protein [Bacteroidales bacterium]
MKHLLIISVLFFIAMQCALSQDNPWEDYLIDYVEVEDPTYKPVLGFGVGMMNFYGDVNNSVLNPLAGSFAYKGNVSFFVDKKHYLKSNLYFLYCDRLSGDEKSYEKLRQNLNFETTITDFGINLHYSFGNFYHGIKLFTPFISIGVENFQFSSKGDLATTINGNEVVYNYWSDGTIRDIPEGSGIGVVVPRDYEFETELRDADLYDLGKYPQYSFAVPVDFGIEYTLSDRVVLRLGTSLHYSFTDNVDNISSQIDESQYDFTGDPRNDMFSYTYVTMHFDLFSSPKEIEVQKLFADVDWDYIFWDDEDNDGIRDGIDECPGTPAYEPVDTAGCPFDSDDDGVPNYSDREFSRQGAVVDENGVEITDADMAAFLTATDAVKRSEVEEYLQFINSFATYRRLTSVEIPDKFKKVDVDGDHYISFEEVLEAIDNFFDFESNLSTDDVYELNNFFFAQ